MSSNGTPNHEVANGHAVDAGQVNQEMKAASLGTTAQEAIDGMNRIQQSTFSTEYERVTAKEAAYDLLTRLETPHELLRRLFSWDPSLSACLGACNEMELFQNWNKDSPTEAKSATELSKMTGCNVDLLRRILRHITAHNVLEYVGNDKYQMGETARALGLPPHMGVVPHGLQMRYAAATNFPVFLKSISFGNPMDAPVTSWEHLTGEKAYPWITSSPQRTQDFQHAMQAYNTSKIEWVDFFPISTLLDSAKPDRPIVVDVGGGHGTDIEYLRKRRLELPKGSLVLQDRAEVIERTTRHETIEGMPHDFFTEQPVKGARAYYLHCVLHDWADADAEKILTHIAGAMEKGYSSLLLHDVVIHEEDPRRMETSSDLQMMMLAVGRDRTEGDLKQLLGKAGLVLKKVWTTPLGPESIVEAVLP